MEEGRDEKKQRARAMPLEVGGKGKDDRKQTTEDRRRKIFFCGSGFLAAIRRTATISTVSTNWLIF
jgi:hypothetical protein